MSVMTAQLELIIETQALQGERLNTHITNY
ncbi:MAG: hypothetical protein RLZZ381_3739 [Cyanobacteriota bacterium]|jgi:hypothetical protein